MSNLLNRFREAGRNGLEWGQAVDLVDPALHDETDPEAFDAASDAYDEGQRDRVREAVKQGVESLCRPRVRLGTDGEWVEESHYELSVWNASALIEWAAQAAPIEPEEIVAIVGEFCPLPANARRLVETALREFQYIPARLAEGGVWHQPAGEVHAEFLSDVIKPMERRGVALTPKLARLAQQSRAWPEKAQKAAKEAAEAARETAEWAFFGSARPAPPPAIVAKQPAAPIAFNVDGEPPLLREIEEWSQTFAYRPVREFAQPAALATLAAIFGRRWATPTGLGLNLYLVAIAETGGGKDALLGVPRRLLAAAGLRHLLGPGDFTSDAAIETSLRMRPAQLMPLDEFGKLAQAMMGRNAPAFAKLAAKTLLEVYPRSEPGSEWTGKQRANPERDNAGEPIFSPTLSILGVSTPEGFFEGMSQQTLEDGFLNRLTVIRAGKEGVRQRDASRRDPPAGLIDTIREAYGAEGNIKEAERRSATSEPHIRVARWADNLALVALEEIEAWQDDAVDNGRRGVCGRVAEQTQKIATLRALARDPADPAVTAEDLRCGFAVVKSSVEAIELGAREMMAGSDFERLCNSIVAAVTRPGPNGLPMSVLLRAKGVGTAHQRDVEAALQRLKITERIYVDIGPTKDGDRPTGRVRPRFDGG